MPAVVFSRGQLQNLGQYPSVTLQGTLNWGIARYDWFSGTKTSPQIYLGMTCFLSLPMEVWLCFPICKHKIGIWCGLTEKLCGKRDRCLGGDGCRSYQEQNQAQFWCGMMHWSSVNWKDLGMMWCAMMEWLSTSSLMRISSNWPLLVQMVTSVSGTSMY